MIRMLGAFAVAMAAGLAVISGSAAAKPAFRFEDPPGDPLAEIKSKLKDVAKPFSLVVELEIKEEGRKAFEETMTACIAATRKEPGCIRYELNRSLSEPGEYTLVERWKSFADLEKHMAAEHTKAALAVMAQHAAEKPEIDVGEPVGD